MIVIPAIDIRNGQCVRLQQGNFSDETVYGEDPVVMAQKWKAQGAKRLHVVDLDGAKNGQPTNLNIVRQIVAKVGIPVQAGGGMQSEKSAIEVLSTGVDRIIIGTLALENELALKRLVEKYPEQIIVSLDAKNGKLAKKGWVENTDMDLIQTAQKLEKLGVEQFIYTNVLKDGTLSSPDYPGIELLQKSVDIPIIVAGGISTVADIKRLENMGVEGVIVGKALYEGKIDLKEVANVS